MSAKNYQLFLLAKPDDLAILQEFWSEKQPTLAIFGIVTKWPFYTKTQVAVHVLIPLSQPHNVRICGIVILGHFFKAPLTPDQCHVKRPPPLLQIISNFLVYYGPSRGTTLEKKGVVQTKSYIFKHPTNYLFIIIYLTNFAKMKVKKIQTLKCIDFNYLESLNLISPPYAFESVHSDVWHKLVQVGVNCNLPP